MTYPTTFVVGFGASSFSFLFMVVVTVQALLLFQGSMPIVELRVKHILRHGGLFDDGEKMC